jgi:predicted acylesterase/phospholipase RssA
MTSKPSSSIRSGASSLLRNSTTRRPGIGLALAGGGPLGAVYEIGALAAIEEAIDGLDLNDADIYVGISAGGIIAAGLANGITPHEMCRLFIESDLDEDSAQLFKPELLLKPAWGELARRLAAMPQLALESLLHYTTRGGRTSLARSFERMKDILPAGLFSGAGIHEYMAEAFAAEGRTNDFRKLARTLVLVATDLDSGESVRFGEPGFDHVPISKAAQASAAVPGLFPPVEIDGRHFVDGALKKTLHASIALEKGVDILICVNPIVPYNAKVMYAPGKLAQGGLLTVLSQSLRTIIHSRVEIGMANYAKTFPDTDILLFEPNQEDAEMFFTNLFSTSNRRRMCESAYQQTREMLWKNRAEIGGRLERHGMRLKLSVLQDTSLTLVKQPVTPKKDRFAVASLSETLDSLERYLKVAHG